MRQRGLGPMYDEQGKQICGAQKVDDTRCRQRPMKGKNRCRIHGGLTPSGPALPQFKSGKWSTALSGAFARRYEEARTNPAILSLQEEIALIDTRISFLLERLETGESDGLWEQLVSAYNLFAEAQVRGDLATMRDAFRDLGDTIQQGSTEREVWSDINGALEQRRRLVESENRREVQAGQYVQIREIMVLLALVVDIVSKHVFDRATINAIINELDHHILNRPSLGVERD